MKIIPSKLLRIEGIVIDEFRTKINPTLSSIPIEENLSLSYSILRSKQEKDAFAVRMKVKTIKKTKLDFHIVVTFMFKILSSELEQQPKRDLVISTMVSISYSTLRGILLRELPLIDLKNRILPPVDLPILLKARERKKTS